MPFENPIVGGTVLRIPAIQSPNFVSGVSGWTINADGTAQFNQLTLIVQSTAAAILIYNGVAALGTLIGSWAQSAGTDQFGNAYPAGLNAVQGTLSGMTISISTLVNCVLTTPTISGGTIGSTMISGGTMSETAITFDTGGGTLKVYSSTTTTVTFSTAGTSTWTAPAGVTSAKVEVWGAGAGGGGGNSTEAGEGGGGGEYAQEPSYPITAGNVYTVQVGQGGPGGFTGQRGQSGTDSLFDNGGVYAQAGQAGNNFVGGAGGNISTNTIHNPGGTGGSGNGNGFLGGAGGGGSAGASGAGGGGTGGGVSSGQPGGAAGAGGGAAGGAGGNSGVGGNNGNAPGGAGGGAGAASTSTQISKTYNPTATYSYYGSQASSGANTKENTNGVMLQGVYSGGLNVNGDQYSFGLYNFSQIRSDFSGATIDSVKIKVQNQHSWYNTGMYLVWGYGTSSSYGSPFVPGAGTHENIQQNWINEGATNTYDLTGVLGSVIASTFTAIMFGPSGSTSGGPTDLWNYGYQTGGTGGPQLSIVGHTGGGGGVQAGSGHDGQVKITYSSGTTLVNTIAPASGTDSLSGTAYPAGIAGIHAGTDYATLGDDGTNAALMFGASGGAQDAELKRAGAGILQTAQLNLSAVLNLLQTTTPSTPGNGVKFWVDSSNVIHFLNSGGIDELLMAAGTGPFKDTSWSLISQPSQTNNGLPGPCSARVKLLPWKMVALEVEFGVQAANTATTQNFGSLPSAAYYPVDARHFPLVSTGTVIGRMFVPTSGGLQAIFTASGANLTFGCNVLYGID